MQFLLAYILGLPVVGWGGLASFILVSFTFLIGYMNHRGVRVIPLKYHKPSAMVALAVVIVHGSIGMLTLLGY